MKLKPILRIAAIIVLAATAGVLISRATNSSAENCTPNKCAQCPSANGCTKK